MKCCRPTPIRTPITQVVGFYKLINYCWGPMKINFIIDNWCRCRTWIRIQLGSRFAWDLRRINGSRLQHRYRDQFIWHQKYQETLTEIHIGGADSTHTRKNCLSSWALLPRLLESRAETSSLDLDSLRWSPHLLGARLGPLSHRSKKKQQANNRHHPPLHGGRGPTLSLHLHDLL
jgi:hypothetical protein